MTRAVLVTASLLLASACVDTRYVPPPPDAGPRDAGPQADVLATPRCGDGVRQGIEACDGSDLGGESCSSLGFGEGTLACREDCRFDGSACESCVPECAGRSCGSDGCGGACGECEDGLVCNTSGRCECVPDCAGAECGSDGCGGSCGACAANEICDSTRTCVCVPSCTGRVCGDDGCGGSCGECGVGTACNSAGACVCVPNCAGRVCGDDGCSGSCGTCGEGTACDSAGACVCVPNCAGRECGDDGCGNDCGFCGLGSACDEATGTCRCVPNCSGRECGPDGCGDSCGTCGTGETCSAGTCVCVPSCGGRVCGDDGCGDVCGECALGEICTFDGRCSVSASPLIVTEVFYDAVSVDNELEWVEILNTSASSISLSGWSIGSGGSSYASSVFQLSGTIPAGGCIVVGGPLSVASNYFPSFAVAADFAPDLENADTAADGVALFNVPASAITPLTVPMDAVIYGSVNTSGLIDETGLVGEVDAPDTGAGGRSIERTPSGWHVQAAPSPNDCSHAR